MKNTDREPLVRTIKEQCRTCYSCVRECPAKAIRISGGQAEVINERCIGCGNCVRVCTQNAKQIRSSIEMVESLLSSGKKVAAIIAPSFPAEFGPVHYKLVVAMIRALGFHMVNEVAFGADLISREYNRLFDSNPGKQYIATTCPAIVFYIEKYHPALVKNLAPIVSPMAACARALKMQYGDDFNIVFIGPCLAKKDEALRDEISPQISQVLTFSELRTMLKARKIEPEDVEPSDFDPPHPGMGALYPIGRGMLQSAGLQEDLMINDIVATSGTKQIIQAIREFETVPNDVRLLELLCCNGCIMGSGMTSEMAQFSRRGYVSAYAKKRYEKCDLAQWQDNMDAMTNLDLTASFQNNDCRLPEPTRDELKDILRSKGKYGPEDELNCGACGYDTCIEHAIAIHRGLAESEMCLPFTIESLRNTALKLSNSYEQIVNAKKALVQSEKLASLGRMASGIAHEINNPLTGVLTFGSLLMEDLKDTEYSDDLKTIVNETMRCRNIVRGILEFARESKLEKELVNINSIITGSIKIFEHHMTFKDVEIRTGLAENIPDIYLDINQMRSVFNNLAENAAHAMPDGGVLTITTRFHSSTQEIVIIVSDTGIGISEENLARIFDPFFTTKQEDKGTGLGLAVTYGIIERHQGRIEVKSTLNVGTTFTIHLPLHQE